MILALARCIYEMHYKPEVHVVEGTIRTFDNKCAGYLEKTASVLQKLGLTKYIDDIGRRSVFVYGPSEFEGIVDAVEAGNVSDEEIEEAVIRLARGNAISNLEVEKLAAIIAGQSNRG